MKVQLTATALAFLFCSTQANAWQLLRTVPGQTGELFGTSMINAGDQNADGFKDVIVGAPGFNGGRGAIYCVSGKYLATGLGQTFVWSLAPTLTHGAWFGWSLTMAGQILGDSAPDIVVGAPYYDEVPGYDGALFVIDGSTHLVARICIGGVELNLGQAVVSVGDQDGDGKGDVVASALGINLPQTYVFFVPGAALASGSPIQKEHFLNVLGPGFFGYSLASGFDLDQDGKQDVAVGSPYLGSGTGRITILKPQTLQTITSYSPLLSGEHFGWSIDASNDYDGDGKVDFVVGSPDWNGLSGGQDGRVLVLSGAKLLAGTTPVELFKLQPLSVGTRFGAAVNASSDLNNDGIGDIIVGTPNFSTQFPPGPGKGGSIVFSGATGSRIWSVSGGVLQHLGDCVLGGPQDLDGDGFSEFLVAGSQSDAPTTDCGTLKCYRLFPSYATPYCTGKVNSLGCTPAISGIGSASMSASTPCNVNCANVINKKNGILFYSHLNTAIPFQGGFLCAKPPIRRTAAQNSGGSTSGSDCTGTFTFDLNAYLQSGIDPSLSAGAEFFCQYWSRDAQSPSTTSLSNALGVLINP